jgi:hypothetical protein
LSVYELVVAKGGSRLKEGVLFALVLLVAVSATALQTRAAVGDMRLSRKPNLLSGSA